MIDFTTTATCRPELLNRTYKSFLSKLTGFDLRKSTLYINIDQLPTGANAGKVVEVAHTYFNSIVVNIPAISSFPTAVQWCLVQPRAKHTFHLEDDWELKMGVDLRKLIALLDNDSGLACVNLRAYATISDDRICLSPGLWRTETAKIIAGRLSAEANPERQLRPKDQTNPYGGKHIGFTGKQYGDRPIITDTGRSWLEGNRLKKDGGASFTTWVTEPLPPKSGKSVVVQPKKILLPTRKIPVCPVKRQ